MLSRELLKRHVCDLVLTTEYQHSTARFVWTGPRVLSLLLPSTSKYFISSWASHEFSRTNVVSLETWWRRQHSHLIPCFGLTFWVKETQGAERHDAFPICSLSQWCVWLRQRASKRVRASFDASFRELQADNPLLLGSLYRARDKGQSPSRWNAGRGQELVWAVDCV